MTGTIEKLESHKRYGFIRGDDKKSYFFHASDFNGFFDDLNNDYHRDIPIRVDFETKESPKGLRASEVSRLDFPNQGR